MHLTKDQQIILDTYRELGCSAGAAAKKLGKSRSTIRSALKRIEAKGQTPWLGKAEVPDNLKMTKTTVQYNAEGKVIQEWRRLAPEAQLFDDLMSEIEQRMRGLGKAPQRPYKKTDTDTGLFEIDLFDPHIGMYSDKDETGDADYDTEKAKNRLVSAVEDLVGRAERPEKAVLVFGGDIQHADNRSNMTEKSGNILDVDTRYGRVINHVATACVDCVNIVAGLSRELEVVVIPGNHDFHTSLWIAQLLKHLYANSPNVTINTQQTYRKAITWGTNLLAWAHGDGVKPNQWAQVIAAEFAREWGQTKFRHLKLGHIHHAKSLAPVMVNEQAGILVEYLEALCPSDAWHASSGYVGNQRGASAFEYHKNHGLMTRHYHRIFYK